MVDSIDLLILPLVRTGDQDQPSVQGLHVAVPPRKPARFRNRDRLALHLTLDENEPLSPEQADKLLANLAKSYYNTAGTVTTALRATAESTNQFLLDRNLRSTSSGHQAVGFLTQIVLREKRLSIAQSGLTHAFLLSSSGVEHVHDLHLAGNGLGLSRTTHIRFSQLDLQPNDAIIISSQSVAGWTPDSLENLHGQGPESLRRRLLALVRTDVNGFLLNVQPGSGELRLLRPVRQPRPVPVAAIPQPIPGEVDEKTEAPSPEVVDGDLSDSDKEEAKIPEPLPETQQTQPGDAVPVITAAGAVSQVTAGEATEPLPTQEQVSGSKSGSFASISQSVSNALLKFLSGLIAILRGILPDSGIFTLPPSTMAFTAVVIPLTIVAVAAVVYFQRGRAAQYELHFSQAQDAAQLAELTTEPRDQRLAWETTLLHLNNAELFQTTDDSQGLRQQAQGIVDSLNATERLDFRPAIVDQLDETAQITRLVAREDALYMLNATDGVVERAILTNEGYRIDTTFQCGPGPYGGYIVGSIIDIAPIPPGIDFKATILAIDANGNLLRCIPGDTPLASPLEPPDINWGSPRGITVDANDLYVLDPQTNAVWIYRGMDVSQSPRLFFDQQIPPMQDVIDIEVNQNDLYLLHEDGHLTSCVYSAQSTSPTRCKEPEIFTDPRPGRQSGPYIEDAFFSQILYSPPPEPTLYLLDPNSHAIYRFSIRLTLDRQHRSQEPLPDGPASAFTLDRGNHSIFLALEDQIYSAPLP
jgi:hypothetical protein